MDRTELVERERTKYNILHGENPKYGGRTGRLKRFKLAKDKLHATTKNSLLHCDNLLDVGCGKGFWIDHFKRAYEHLEIVGLDISEECQKFRSDLKMVIASADDMPFDDNSFDFVNHMDGLEHIPEEMEYDVMEESYRVAKKYMYYNIALHAVGHHDLLFEKKGLGAVHINMKSVKEWKRVFIDFAERHDVKEWIYTANEYWAMVYLEL